MERITVKNLEAVVDRINTIAGTPPKPWVRGEDGTVKGQIGNYHLDGAYGGYALHQMVNEGGGITATISGYRSKRELYDMLHTFIRGMEVKQTAKN